MSDTRDTHAVDYVAEIDRLKADVENRDKAIERMRRESISMRIAANLDRIEAALGLPTNQPIAIEMILGRIEKMTAALARVTAQRDYFIRMVAEAVPVEIPALLHPHGLRIENGEVEEASNG